MTRFSEFAVDAPPRLRLSVPAGRIEVHPSDDGRVEVELTALRNDETTLHAVERARVEAVERGGRQMIRVDVPKREGGLLSLGRQPSVGVSIHCPAGCDVEVDSASADVELRADCGTVTVKTASGDLVAARVAALSVTSASGDVEVAAIDGDLAVKTASGDVSVDALGGVGAVNSVSGDVRLGTVSGTVTAGTVSGDLTIETLSAGGLRANAVSGDVVVGVEPGLRLWIDAQSVSGSMRSDLELGEGGGSGRGDTIELRVRTVSGDVHIRRA